MARVVLARGVRGFADGFISVLLAPYLVAVGFSPLQIGAIVTATLVGSALLTLAAGLCGDRLPPRSILLLACGLMAATGLGFASVSWFWPLLVVALVGTLNPSSGDVSVFLPTEQALIAGHVEGSQRARTYAIYNVAGAVAGALGALASAVPEPLARVLDREPATVQRAGFFVYVAVALVLVATYRGLEAGTPRAPEPGRSRRPLQESRRIVVQLAALFSLDSAGSGLVVQSLLVLWLHLRFDLPAATTGAVFFAAGLLGASSQLLAGRLASRIGFVRTMVFTHLPGNILLAVAAFAPRADIAIGLLLARALCSSMDQPARQAFVMTVVPPAERAAAASVTNVPRSLAAAATPLLGGLLLSASSIGWPLLIAGGVKVVYDVLLLVLYRDLPVAVAAPPAPAQP